MAVSKKIQKVLEVVRWDSGWGQVELMEAGLKYIKFYIRGDHGHTHRRFENVLTKVTRELGYTCTLVETRELGEDDGTDFYSAETKFKIE